MSGPAAMARVRACLDAAEASVGWPAEHATAAERQRNYGAQHAEAARRIEAECPALAATYRATAREHEATAERIEREEEAR